MAFRFMWQPPIHGGFRNLRRKRDSIEQRDGKEVTHIAGRQMVPDGVEVENPAFDVTPAKYVTAIVTEKGIARAPYEESLRRLAPERAAG